MTEIFIEGVLSIANILLSIFVLAFAIIFLRKTVHHRNRNPWLFLMVAISVFFLMQVLNILSILGFMNVSFLRYYLDSMFIAIVLFTFIFQYNLVLNSELIVITKNSKHAVKVTEDFFKLRRGMNKNK